MASTSSLYSSASLLTGLRPATAPPSTRAEQSSSRCVVRRSGTKFQPLFGSSASNFVAGSCPGLARAVSALGRGRRHDGLRSAGAVCMATEEKADPSPGPAIWIGRVAMLAWTAAIVTEIVTGKGVLASVGVTSPAPTLAVALAAVVGGATAFSIFTSASSSK